MDWYYVCRLTVFCLSIMCEVSSQNMRLFLSRYPAHSHPARLQFPQPLGRWSHYESISKLPVHGGAVISYSHSPLPTSLATSRWPPSEHHNQTSSISLSAWQATVEFVAVYEASSFEPCEGFIYQSHRVLVKSRVSLWLSRLKCWSGSGNHLCRYLAIKLCLLTETTKTPLCSICWACCFSRDFENENGNHFDGN